VGPLTATTGPIIWQLYVKVLPRNLYQLPKIKHFLNLHARNLFFRAHIQSITDYESTLLDLASANAPKPSVSLHKRSSALGTFAQNHTLAISVYSFLSSLPLKERLDYSKGVKRVLMHKIVSGKVTPYLTAKCSLKQSEYCGKLNVPIPRTDLFKSGLVYSVSVL